MQRGRDSGRGESATKVARNDHKSLRLVPIGGMRASCEVSPCGAFHPVLLWTAPVNWLLVAYATIILLHMKPFPVKLLHVSREFRLEKFLPFRLNLAATELSERLLSIYGDEFGLDIPQWRILANLAAVNEVTARDVARITHSHKSTISRAVQHLEERGLVQRLVSERDRRAFTLTLTTEGRKLLRRLLPLVLRFESDLLAALTDSERRALETGLRALEAAIRAQVESR